MSIQTGRKNIVVNVVVPVVNSVTAEKATKAAWDATGQAMATGSATAHQTAMKAHLEAAKHYGSVLESMTETFIPPKTPQARKNHGIHMEQADDHYAAYKAARGLPSLQGGMLMKDRRGPVV